MNSKSLLTLAKAVKVIGHHFVDTAKVHLIVKSPQERRKAFVENTSQKSKKLSQDLHLKVRTVMSRNDLFDSEKFFIVSNHLSYLDILLIAQSVPSVFITSKEMQKTPVLGQICEAGGCLFVDRQNPTSLKKDIAQMTEVMNQGFNTVVFPEGTSGTGETVMPFKKGLFKAAPLVGHSILPVCIRYLKVDGEPFSKKNHEKVAWYGDMSFAPHFLSLAKLQEIKAEVAFLEPIPVKPDSDLRALADKAHQRIKNYYHRGNFPKWEST